MIINPDNFPAIFLDGNKSNFRNIPLTLDNQAIKSFPSADLLGINLDDNLNFNLHVTNIFRSAANQLNALIKLKSYLSFDAKTILISSYITANFDQCSLMSIFSTTKSLNKMNVSKRQRFDFYTILTQYLMKIYQKSKVAENECIQVENFVYQNI